MDTVNQLIEMAKQRGVTITLSFTPLQDGGIGVGLNEPLHALESRREGGIGIATGVGKQQ